MSTVATTSGTSDDLYLPIPIAGEPRPSTISLLVPFDIGQTFIFKSRGRNVEAEWRSIFSGHPHEKDWATDQKELDGFDKSMGWIAVWRCFGGTEKPHLATAIERLGTRVPGELDTDADGIRAIIFPNGIGVLIVRIKTAPLGDPRWSCLNDKKIKAERRAACRVLLATASACYLDFMYRAVKLGGDNGARAVEQLRPVERTHHIVRAEYTYPLFFFSTPGEANQFAGAPTRAVTSYNDAKLLIGWQNTVVSHGGVDQRVMIERNFVIALAGWFALVMMNNRATHYILDAIHALAADQTPNALEGEAVRLAYMEASNQAFPIQWTSSEKDLLLLEAIHDSWSSQRWWKTVERKTNLLAAYSAHVSDDADQHWNQKITAFGAGIACVTLVSAIVDAMSLLSSSRPTDQPGTDVVLRFGIAVGGPLILVSVLWFFIWRALRGKPRRPEVPFSRNIPRRAYSAEPTGDELGSTPSARIGAMT